MAVERFSDYVSLQHPPRASVVDSIVQGRLFYGPQVDSGGYTESGDWSGVTATYVSRTQVLCSLPAAGSYVISVSNVEGSLSNTLLLSLIHI